MRQGYCYSCLAIGGGYFGRVTCEKHAPEINCPNFLKDSSGFVSWESGRGRPQKLQPKKFPPCFNVKSRGSLVAQCSATPATVAATPPCGATPFQTQISVRHLPAQRGGGATPKFLGGVARHRCYTCKTQ